MDDKVALYRECYFPNLQTHVEKVIFVGFRMAIAPSWICPWLSHHRVVRSCGFAGP